MAWKRTFHEIIDLLEMPDGEIVVNDHNARQQQNAGSVWSIVDPGSRASGTRNANPEVQTGRVEGKNSYPRVRQPAGPSLS